MELSIFHCPSLEVVPVSYDFQQDYQELETLRNKRGGLRRRMLY